MLWGSQASGFPEVIQDEVSMQKKKKVCLEYNCIESKTSIAGSVVSQRGQVEDKKEN